MKRSHSVLQRAVAARLATTRRADSHDAEANLESLEQFDALNDEPGDDLQTGRHARVLDGSLQGAVVHRWDLKVRVQIADDTLEEG